MDFSMLTNGKTCQIRMNGSFTYNDNHKFRDIIHLLSTAAVNEMDLDFAGVDFVDSAALGMLLLLRDESQKRGVDMTLRSPHGQVEKMFTLSKFDQLFSIAK